MDRIVGAGLAACLSIVLSAHAQQPQGPREGIKVHGHWVIDVRNPDGSLARHQEFENALTARGAAILSALLYHDPTANGVWTIRLTNSGGPCAPYACDMREIGAPLPPGAGTATVATMKITPFQIPLPNSNGGMVVGGATFAGWIQATTAGNIRDVSTQLQICSSSAPCASDPVGGRGFFSFTETTLAAPIAVLENQIVQVSVTISFS